MAFLIGLLTLVMVLDCLLLILLVLIQLPKKEAGAGMAFGGSATDALFGAGSGTVLTKITKYAAAAFFIMALGLSVLQSTYHRRSGIQFQKKIEQADQTPLSTAPLAPPPKAPTTNALLPKTMVVEATNTLPITNAAPTVPPATNIPNPGSPAK